MCWGGGWGDGGGGGGEGRRCKGNDLKRGTNEACRPLPSSHRMEELIKEDV
jgi:hypothetical protein